MTPPLYAPSANGAENTRNDPSFRRCGAAENKKAREKQALKTNQVKLRRILMHIPEEEIIWHDHGDGVMHSHSHGHAHTQTKAVINRLSRAIGHLESVKRMVESGRDCTDVLLQLAAVRSALNSTAKVILKDHLEHCISDTEVDAAEQLKALNEAIDKFMS